MQIVGSSLLGLTMQCAKCHDHKFEPVSQREYYQLQAVFYPAFNVENWIKPNERSIHAATCRASSKPGKSKSQSIDRANCRVARRSSRFGPASIACRAPCCFDDEFAEAGPALADAGATRAPGDDQAGRHAGGESRFDRSARGASRRRRLADLESGAAGDRCYRPANRSTGRPTARANGFRSRSTWSTISFAGGNSG